MSEKLVGQHRVPRIEHAREIFDRFSQLDVTAVVTVAANARLQQKHQHSQERCTALLRIDIHRHQITHSGGELRVVYPYKRLGFRRAHDTSSKEPGDTSRDIGYTILDYLSSILRSKNKIPLFFNEKLEWEWSTCHRRNFAVFFYVQAGEAGLGGDGGAVAGEEILALGIGVDAEGGAVGY